MIYRRAIKLTIGILLPIITLFVVIIIVGCSDPVRNATVMLFDTSGSTSGVRDVYQKDSGTVINTLAGGCGEPKNPLPRETAENFIIAYKISKNSQATACDSVSTTLQPSGGLLGNSMNEDKNRKTLRDAYCTDLNAFIKKDSKDPYTDIFDAITVAAKIMEGKSGYDGKMLIVFSDMLQQTPEYNFGRESLSEQRISTIIAELKQKNRLPNLKGVKVWIAGAGANRTGGLSPNKLQQVQDFWMSYFKATGADLTNDRYAPSLINFEIAKAKN